VLDDPPALPHPEQFPGFVCKLARPLFRPAVGAEAVLAEAELDEAARLEARARRLHPLACAHITNINTLVERAGTLSGSRLVHEAARRVPVATPAHLSETSKLGQTGTSRHPRRYGYR